MPHIHNTSIQYKQHNKKNTIHIIQPIKTQHNKHVANKHYTHNHNTNNAAHNHSAQNKTI